MAATARGMTVSWSLAGASVRHDAGVPVHAAGEGTHATARVAVVDPLPMFREGVVTVLAAAGHHAETPGDVVAWAGRHRPSLVLLTMCGELEWRLLARLRELDGHPPLVVGLIDAASAAEGARLVRAGARSVLPRDAAASALQRTVEATLDGQAVLPAEVAAVLAAPTGRVAGIPADRARWLRKLASGTTVAQLAAEAGYTERAMFRLLSALYREMGARNRIDAIMQARDRGWI